MEEFKFETKRAAMVEELLIEAVESNSGTGVTYGCCSIARLAGHAAFEVAGR